MPRDLNRREFIGRSAGLLAAGAAVPSSGADQAPAACVLENRHVRWTIAADGRTLYFLDKHRGKDYSAGGPAFAAIDAEGRTRPAAKVVQAEGLLHVEFRGTGARATIRATARPEYMVLEVVAVEGPAIDGLALADVRLALSAGDEEKFATVALALNLKTNVAGLPLSGQRLRATCYARFGMVGAAVALLACPVGELRRIMQEAVSAAAELPHSPLGGPWALDKPINRGSYLFNSDGISEQAAGDWIALARSLGMTQINFHGGHSFRFGDCLPNPKIYPQGFDSLKRVIDRLHDAGISAGLHTYSFFIAKTCPWVTPVPDRRLAGDAILTLAEDLPAPGKDVRVDESTDQMSAITGFFVRNSVTLRIDDELIVYTGASKSPPFGFTGCRRGALGTRAAAHRKGAKVHHLKECFGLLVPDSQTTLFAEVAAKTAEAFNRCGFDMIYLDALDGEDILGGAKDSWHYGSRFVFEIWKRLARPAVMEMSTFHHHLWYVRSRYGAWDHPNRSHKKFIDVHCLANEQNQRMFLPSQLGWWALKTWTGPQGEPTFADDVEYLAAKCLATDTGMSLMGINPQNVDKIPALPRLARIIRNYEALRSSGRVPESVKARLRVPGDEYTLAKDPGGDWRFRPAEYASHRVEAIDGRSNRWHTTNKFGARPLRLRIEALMAAGPYDAPGNVVLADFEQTGSFALRAVDRNVSVALTPSADPLHGSSHSGCFAAANRASTRLRTWASASKIFKPPLNFSGHKALGVWVYGDGQGELLNLQLRSPSHTSHGIGEHYIVVDFTGWRYFELVEPEGGRYADYLWPYGHVYSIYRESVNPAAIDSLSLWYNNLPAGGQVKCYLSPIKALPLVTGRLVRPSVTLGNKTIEFPVEIESGCYLEFHSAEDCRLYGPTGELLQQVRPIGDIPQLAAGENEILFRSGSPTGVNARARVTVITTGDPLPERISVPAERLTDK